MGRTAYPSRQAHGSQENGAAAPTADGRAHQGAAPGAVDCKHAWERRGDARWCPRCRTTEVVQRGLF